MLIYASTEVMRVEKEFFLKGAARRMRRARYYVIPQWDAPKLLGRHAGSSKLIGMVWYREDTREKYGRKSVQCRDSRIHASVHALSCENPTTDARTHAAKCARLFVRPSRKMMHVIFSHHANCCNV